MGILGILSFQIGICGLISVNLRVLDMKRFEDHNVGPTPWGLLCHIRLHICEIGSLPCAALGEQLGVKCLAQGHFDIAGLTRIRTSTTRASGSLGRRPDHSAIPPPAVHNNRNPKRDSRPERYSYK